MLNATARMVSREPREPRAVALNPFTIEEIAMRSYTFSVTVTLRNGARVSGFMTGQNDGQIRRAVRDTVQGRDATAVVIVRL